ncbi:iron-containing alcohol dehydrogenase [Mesotoga sp. BH458_6_3_2_1]|uniref:iron-containing alcohol dehydrogenase n=2 Tax=unclassified Mesotoga TaxID=1184398 RepID=UPI000EF1E6D7|nr:iron-containing alcohol dehydrogenase [Mesotoga sp. BH458_6_3_2_1]RLL87955.1 butanol dehydrogenase [Mesotoga sp. BH458_6_3_2_1]
MLDFTFHNATKIVFGRDTEKQVGQEISRYGKKVLLHYGGGSIKKTGLYDRVVKSLKESGVEIFELGGVKPNPRLSLVKEGIELCRKNGIDAILAVGGGSVIDSAKAIGIGVPYEGDVWDFYSKGKKVEEMLPLGVVLTIPAAGSESSGGSVITNEDGWYKRATNSVNMRAKFAIMNPELTFTLPNYQTAVGAVDIMSHVMERYFTNVKNVDFTDRLCEATLRTMIRNTPIALREPENYDARAEIMWAGTIAHNDLLSTGRIGDWATHGIEHELSAIYDIAHGGGLAIMWAPWMTYVYKHDIERFAQFAYRVWDVEPNFRNPEKAALEGIKRLKEFFASLGIPVTLTEAGILDDKFDEMAKKATEDGPLGQFVKLYKDNVKKIYELAK